MCRRILFAVAGSLCLIAQSLLANDGGILLLRGDERIELDESGRIRVPGSPNRLAQRPGSETPAVAENVDRHEVEKATDSLGATEQGSLLDDLQQTTKTNFAHTDPLWLPLQGPTGNPAATESIRSERRLIDQPARSEPDNDGLQTPEAGNLTVQLGYGAATAVLFGLIGCSTLTWVATIILLRRPPASIEPTVHVKMSHVPQSNTPHMSPGQRTQSWPAQLETTPSVEHDKKTAVVDLADGPLVFEDSFAERKRQREQEMMEADEAIMSQIVETNVATRTMLAPTPV